MIKIINRINKNKDEVIVIQGSILEMVDKSERVIYDLMPNDYPSSAIIEGVKNAVLYRKYSSVNRVIEISIGYKSVSINSPGALIEKSNLGKKISHSKRNIWIYEKLITLDNNKRFLNNGRGFSRMKKAFYGVGKVKLINSIKDDYFKVILPGVSIYDK